jgi:hypothetical protein
MVKSNLVPHRAFVKLLVHADNVETSSTTRNRLGRKSDCYSAQARKREPDMFLLFIESPEKRVDQGSPSSRYYDMLVTTSPPRYRHTKDTTRSRYI